MSLASGYKEWSSVREEIGAGSGSSFRAQSPLQAA
jgi:hypothetical protein